MRRLAFPLLLAALLLAGSSLALRLAAAAAPPAQAATRTPQRTTTARATGTAQASPTRGAQTSPTAQATGTVTATAEVTGTATPGDDEDDGATITDTEVITGSVLPLRFANPDLTGVDVTRTLTVVGNGIVTAAPDAASITLGVETTGDDVAETTEQNNEAIAALLEAINDLDIPARNVQTSNFTIFIERPSQPFPEPAQSDEEVPAVTYHVSQQVTVRIEALEDNLDLVSDLIEAAVEAGANNVFGPNFQLGDNRALQQRARRAAVEDAYQRAQDLATLTGVELVGVATVSQVPSFGGPLASGEAADAALGGGTNLAPGTLSYSEQVQVVFYIR